ncbi:MAG: Gfo/Idh/MocA family oxidoreductase [Akkermansiaceae bacterium]|nr:Gfo/Idh/MocA family oxidoreductase [Armatimonadota bacterium]
MRELKVGFVGSGGMVGTHGQRLLRLRRDAGEAVRVVGIHARNADKASLVADKIAKEDASHGTVGYYSDFDTLLAEKLDALFVCLPPDAPVPYCVRAAEHGVALFLEKPIALDVAGAETVVNAVEKAGTLSQVGYHMRFRAGVRRLKSLIESGDAGRGTLFTGRFYTNFRGPEWWADEARSGGQVHEQVIHLYDLALHLFGAATTASGFVANLVHENDPTYTVEDTSLGTVRFASGAVASVAGSNAAVPNRFVPDFRVVCGRASLEYRSTGDWRDKDTATLFTHAGPMSNEFVAEEFAETEDPYLLQARRFLQVLRGTETEFAPAREGLDGVRVVAAVKESARQNGVPVRVE